MRAWLRLLAEMELEDGPLFRPIDRWGNLLVGPMSKKSVRRMIRHYLAVPYVSGSNGTPTIVKFIKIGDGIRSRIRHEKRELETATPAEG